MLKTLPLRLLVVRIVFAVSIVGAVDETEVYRSLNALLSLSRVLESMRNSHIVKTARLGTGVIL